MPDRVDSVSIILPVIDETQSLSKTVEVIESQCADKVTEYLVVVCAKTKPASRETIQRLIQQYGGKVRLLEQNLPFLGGAVRDAFDATRGSHVVMMASDLETPPDKVLDLINAETACPHGIVTATRWKSGGGFVGYSVLKYILNYLFQGIFRLMYRTRLSDLTYGYRIFPTALVQAIKWEELKHPFLFETLVKPLRLGIPVKEIPCSWIRRDEGASNNTFLTNFVYFRTGLKTLLTPRAGILK
jgi:glycosyltransferase involved in cell wall biosynthesis